MEAVTLERTNMVLKKSIPQIISLNEPIYNLDNYRFIVSHSLSKPLHLRFTFFDEDEQASTYHVLDIFDGVLFDIYAVSSDANKIFHKLEIYSDVDVLIHLKMELLIHEEETKSFVLN